MWQHSKFSCLLVLLIMLFRLSTMVSDNGVQALPVESESLFIDHNLGPIQGVYVTRKVANHALHSSVFQYESQNSALFLLLNVVNTGSELRKIIVVVQINELIWEREFYNSQSIYDIHYNFNLENELFLPLDGINSSRQLLSPRINITLEFYPSIAGINAIFNFNSIIIREVFGIAESDLIFIPDIFKIRFEKVSPLQKQRFVLNSVFLSKIPSNAKLYVTVLLKTKIEVESLVLLGTALTSTPKLEPPVCFTMILDKNFTELGIKISPIEATDVGDYTIILSVQLIELQRYYNPILNPSIDFPDHPIPVEIMTIIFIGLIFGVPLYVISNEQKTIEGKQTKKLGER